MESGIWPMISPTLMAATYMHMDLLCCQLPSCKVAS